MTPHQQAEHMIALVPLVTSKPNALASKELSIRVAAGTVQPPTRGGSGMTALIGRADQTSRNAMEWNDASPNDQ
jgi:hypothetical protein